MLYQKLLIGSNPYYISVEKTSAFEIHRHPEFELSYCLKGEYDIICENKRYLLKKGDFAIIPPMAAHEFPSNNHSGKRITIEVGYAFLGNFFKLFANQNSNCIFYQKSDLHPTALYNELVTLLEETASIHCSNSAFSELFVKANLYKISALLLQMTYKFETNDAQSKSLTDIENIDQALEIIYNNYYEPLNIEEISTFCGYSKSNFCKIFKTITGDTFHNTLNRHRIDISCMLLSETNYTIERIAQETGFTDSKSFCRVFKKFMNQSAGEYRKRTAGIYKQPK